MSCGFLQTHQKARACLIIFGWQIKKKKEKKPALSIFFPPFMSSAAVLPFIKVGTDFTVVCQRSHPNHFTFFFTRICFIHVTDLARDCIAFLMSVYPFAAPVFLALFVQGRRQNNSSHSSWPISCMNTLILNCFWGRKDELSSVDIVLHGKEEGTKGGFFEHCAYSVWSKWTVAWKT